MKKIIGVLFITMFAFNYLSAQNSEALTNSTIIKMVKAKLSDDIIIDEINNSSTNFNISADSVIYLSLKNVSDPIIKAMKAVTVAKTTSVPTASTINTSYETPTGTINENTQASTKNKYFIITRSYKTLQEAETAVSTLNANGLAKAEIVGKNNAGSWRVSYKSYSSREEAGKELPFVQQSFSDAWIFYDNSIANSDIKQYNIQPVNSENEAVLTNKETSIQNVAPKVEEPILVDNKTSVQTPASQNIDTLRQTDLNESDLIIKEPIVKTNQNLESQYTDQAETKAEQPKEELKEKVSSEKDNKTQFEKSEITFNASTYTIPVEELMRFFDDEMNMLAGLIQGWDHKIKDSIVKGNKIKESILIIEKELYNKKNIDSKTYTDEIIALKNKLSVTRTSFKLLKTNVLADGAKITKSFLEISKNKEELISDKFSDVSSKVKKTHPKPSLGENTKTITLTKKEIDFDIVNHVLPLTEMLIFYQNEIISLKDVMILWSDKANAVIQKDVELAKQLEPLLKEMDNYNLTPKNYKNEISTLKKQISLIEKERNRIENEMENDSKDLADYLKKISKEVQDNVKTRFSDIIDSINFSYQDKL